MLRWCLHGPIFNDDYRENWCDMSFVVDFKNDDPLDANC